MIKFANSINEANLITHDGVFHGDEVIATAILVLANENEKELKIFRTHNIEGANENAIIYDIGHTKYDHHQIGGNGTRYNGIPYASAGLIWKEYSEKVIKNFIPESIRYNKNAITRIINYIDKTILEGVDARDNGIDINNSANINIYSISDIITSYNPDWNSSESSNDRFIQAVNMAIGLLKRIITHGISIIEASDLIESGIENSNNKILILDKYMPWIGTLYNSKNPKASEIAFCVFPNNRNGYNIQTVPINPNSKIAKIPFPQEWWGHPEKTNISGCTFIHNTGFLAACKTKEDAIELAKKANEIFLKKKE